MCIGIRFYFHTRVSSLSQPPSGLVLWVLRTSVFAGVVHAAAVTESSEKAAVTGITRVAAGQLVAQARLLVWNTAAWWTCASPLELDCIRNVLWGLKRQLWNPNLITYQKLHKWPWSSFTFSKFILKNKSNPNTI